MRCPQCEGPLRVERVLFAHACPAFPPDGRIVVERRVERALPLLVALAESVARTFPSDGSTWGNDARAALAAAREEGLA